MDTGATVSLVSREFISGPLKPCSLQARGIGREDPHVLGSTELHVCLGMSKVFHQFLVVGMRNTCILAPKIGGNGCGHSELEAFVDDRGSRINC